MQRGSWPPSTIRTRLSGFRADRTGKATQLIRRNDAVYRDGGSLHRLAAGIVTLQKTSFCAEKRRTAPEATRRSCAEPETHHEPPALFSYEMSTTPLGASSARRAVLHIRRRQSAKYTIGRLHGQITMVRCWRSSHKRAAQFFSHPTASLPWPFSHMQPSSRHQWPLISVMALLPYECTSRTN
jgi:hypothetical protein